MVLFAGLLTGTLIAEAVTKTLLYYNKFHGTSNVPNEKLIYGSSAILDLAQMTFTLVGLLPS